ncbi:MAG: GNAT family N-acetyltransferase [Nitrososphaerales archaeon]
MSKETKATKLTQDPKSVIAAYVGQNVKIRALAEGDLDDISACDNNPGAVGVFDHFLSFPVEEYKDTYRLTLAATSLSRLFIIINNVKEKKIGYVFYAYPHPHLLVNLIEIGYRATDISERNRGFAKEAVKLLVNIIFQHTIKIERIQATTDANNVPSIRVLSQRILSRGTSKEILHVE